MRRMVMGERGRRPARPARPSRPSAREQHPLLPSPVGKLSVSLKQKRAKKKGLLPQENQQRLQLPDS